MTTTWQLQHSWDGEFWSPGADRTHVAVPGSFFMDRIPQHERDADEEETSCSDAVGRYMVAVEYWRRRDILRRPMLRVLRIEHIVLCSQSWDDGGHVDSEGNWS